jgi:hypothetical protein
MNKRISRLLGEPEAKVTKLISELEAKNGHPSHDVRMIAENVQKVRAKVTQLGLDPDDTTGEELYHALLSKFDKDSRAFDEYFSLPNLNFDQQIAKAARIIEQSIILPRRWALKNAAAKSILREQPPKHVMKFLRYRSLESMLKRENVSEIFLAAQVLESTTWQKAQLRLVSKLDQTDLLLKPVKISPLNYHKWSKVDTKGIAIVRDNSLANFSIWPTEEAKSAPLLTMILLLLEEYGRYEKINLTKSLIKSSGMVEWWIDMDHLIAGLAGDSVSLCLHDAAVNSLYKNHYKNRSLEQARTNFWQELVSRYDNLPQLDGIFDRTVQQKIEPLKLAAPDPVFEFAEDF